jgi:hypothetical protein
MAYDAKRQRVVLFGGTVGGSWGEQQDTWEYDGTDWVQMSPVSSPEARSAAAMAYDAAQGKIVLYGGQRLPNMYADTWEYDGVDWVRTSPPVETPFGSGFSMAYDEPRSRAVMFGGSQGGGIELDGTWEYDGVNWLHINLGTSPAGRHSHSMAYDVARRKVVLFGGHDAADLFSDTWTYGFDSSFPDELCYNGIDDDGDGLFDCADPDCTLWPSCQPGELCANGADDDGDGLIDCADPNCGGFACGAMGQTCSAGVCGPPIDPCNPSPCSHPPENHCMGDTAHRFSQLGTCVETNGVADCDYQPTDEDCSLSGRICVEGACVMSGPGVLLISEYVEGNNLNKFIEIYNAGGAAVQLSGHKLKLYANGSPTPTGTVVLGSYLLQPGQVYVVAHPQAVSTGFTVPDLVSSSLDFDGNDDVQLTDPYDVQLDIVGEIGVDVQIGVDVALIRNAGITVGTSSGNWVIGEWTSVSYTQNQLGSH